MSSDQQQRASAILAELMRRQDAGEHFTPEEILAAHPELESELRDFFAIEKMLEDASSAAEGVAQHADRGGANNRETAGPSAGDSVPVAHGRFHQLPVEFGRYRIQRVLGQGAMGAVYLAHDTKLDRKVALKIPKLDDSDDGELIERFEREARAAATLHHRNLCPVFDVGVIDGIHFLTMAYIEGKPLSSFVSETKPLSRKQAATISRKLALGLQDAHAQGIIHRDLKPANVMIDKSREPVVMDFGLAHRAENTDRSRLTGVGVLMGSPAYMSPEQLSGDPSAVGPSSDIYSLGVVLFELLTGRLPYEGSVAAVIGQIMTADPPDITQLRSTVDPELAAICAKLMSKSPSDRYRSMTEVAAAFTAYLKQHQDALATQSGSQPIVQAADQIEQIIEQDSSIASPAVRLRRKPSLSQVPRHTWVITAAVAGCVLLASVIIYFKSGDRVEISGDAEVTITTNEQGEVESVTTAPVTRPGTPASNPSSTTEPSPDEDTASTATRSPDSSSRELFNGRDLTGWESRTPGWQVRDGALLGTGKCWLITEDEFSDYDLTLEYRLPRDGNSGVFLRAWPGGKANGGDFPEIQLLDDTSPRFAKVPPEGRTGSLWNRIAATPTLKPPPNEWHALRILLHRGHLKVWINSTIVLDSPLPTDIRSSGRVGLQSTSSVEFRQLRLQDLSNDGQPQVATPSDQPTSSIAETLTLQAGGDVRWMTVSPDGRFVATTGVDTLGQITVWDTRDGTELNRFRVHEHGFTNLSYSSDGRAFLFATGQAINAVDSETGELIREFAFPASPRLSVFPDCSWVAALYSEQPGQTNSDKAMFPQYFRIFDWKSGETLCEHRLSIAAGYNFCHSPAVSPDGRYLTAAIRQQYIRWNIESTNGTIALTDQTMFEKTLLTRGRLVFSPDSRYAAGPLKSKQGLFVVFDVRTGGVLHYFASQKAKQSFGCSMAFTSDSQGIVAADFTGEVSLWDVTTGALAKNFHQHQSESTKTSPGVLVTADGRIITGGGSEDRTLVIHPSTSWVQKTP